MQNKIDVLIDAIGDLRESMGGVRSDIRTLFKQSDDDRSVRKREHDENQIRIGQLAQSQQSAISELRDTATKRWDETTKSLENLTRVVEEQGHKLDDHAKTVAVIQPQVQQLQISRGRLIGLASIGLFVLWLMGQALEAGVQRLVGLGLKKFGS